MSPSIVEVGELCVVRQIESFAADSSVSKVMTSIPPGVELLYQTKYLTMVLTWAMLTEQLGIFCQFKYLPH